MLLFSLVSIGIVILIVFLYVQNQKDKRDLTKRLNEDYKTTRRKESEPNDSDESV